MICKFLFACPFALSVYLFVLLDQEPTAQKLFCSKRVRGFISFYQANL